MGTSAPLLTQPSLTGYLSNYPLWPDRGKDSTVPSSRPSSPSGSIPSVTITVKSPQPPPTAPSIKRGRGRGRPRKITHQQKVKGKTVPKVRKLKPSTQTEPISEPIPTETQTTAQIQMWHMCPTRLSMRAGNERKARCSHWSPGSPPAGTAAYRTSSPHHCTSRKDLLWGGTD